MKTKKIDLIVKYFIPVTAGIEVNILETYSKLVKKGWDVTIHTSNDTYLLKNHLSTSEKIKGIKIKRYPFKWYGFFPQIDYSKQKIIALHNFDIFPHLHLLIKILIDNFFHKKEYVVVLTPHGGLVPEWSTFSFFQRIIKKTYHQFIASILINNTVNVVRAVSEWEKEEIIKLGVNKDMVIVITNGIEDEAYLNVEKLASKNIKDQVNSFGKYILQIGRVYKIKNYETVIRSLELIPKNVNFVIAGPIQDNDIYKKMLDKLIEEKRLGSRVFFIGVVKGIDKYYLIKHAQMMVHMALWESFCNVVHEGLSQGLVCIVANNTALPLLIKNRINGFCVETKNYIELAKKINFVLKNKNSPVIKFMEKTNKIKGLENSWEDVSVKVNILYNKIIKYEK